MMAAEVLLMCKLRHPCIVTFLGACWEPFICLVLEFMPAGSLDKLLWVEPGDIDARADLTWDEPLLKMATDCALAMSFLHAFTPPIIHRDLKSPNLLISADRGGVKLADFGESRAEDLEYTMTTVGSPLWMAPEVLRRERYGPSADVFGYGMVLLEMATLAKPWATGDTRFSMHAVSSGGRCSGRWR